MCPFCLATMGLIVAGAAFYRRAGSGWPVKVSRENRAGEVPAELR